MEDHYGRPMGIEWAKDEESAEPFILQARPEINTISCNKGKSYSLTMFF